MFNFDYIIYIALPNFCALAFGYYLLSFLKLLLRNFVSPILFSKRNQIKKIGNWVVITGATDGIGKAFAELLAKDKFNLVLISRSNEKLEKVKAEILEKYKINIQLICADFTRLDIYENIEKELKNLDVALLINNVGMSSEFPDYLTSERNTPQYIINMINCNCLSTVLMTRLLLKLGMGDKGGMILNISSASSVFPIPFLSAYGSSKAFINSFTKNMSSEMKNTKVHFQTAAPFFVSSKMSRLRASLTSPCPIVYANSVLDRLGTCSFTYGYFIHELQGWFIEILPNCLIEKLTYNVNFTTRLRAIRKAAKIN